MKTLVYRLEFVAPLNFRMRRMFAPLSTGWSRRTIKDDATSAKIATGDEPGLGIPEQLSKGGADRSGRQMQVRGEQQLTQLHGFQILFVKDAFRPLRAVRDSIAFYRCPCVRWPGI